MVKRLAFLMAAAVAALVYATRPGVQAPSGAAHKPAPAQTARVEGAGQAKPAVPSAPPPAVQPKPSAPVAAGVEQALRARVTAYWRARAKSDLNTAYTYYEPSFRKAYTPQQFLLKFQRLVRFKPEFLGIDRIAFEPGGRTAAVFVRLRTRPDVIDKQELISVTEESWLLSGGVWCKKAEALQPVF